MHPLAHHAGEQALVPLLLLAGGGLGLVSRARAAASRARPSTTMIDSPAQPTSNRLSSEPSPR